MIEAEEIQSILTEQLPGAEVTVQDLTGTKDHYGVLVMWQGFKDMRLVAQHQKVNTSLQGPLGDGRLHALKIKTMVPPDENN